MHKPWFVISMEHTLPGPSVRFLIPLLTNQHPFLGMCKHSYLALLRNLSFSLIPVPIQLALLAKSQLSELCELCSYFPRG